MNGADRKLMALALKKQRLQIESGELRDRFAGHARGLEPAFGAADALRDGLTWLRQRPAIPLGIFVAVLVARPRAAWRWGRRAFVAWRGWRRARNYLMALPTGRQA